jgi:hypothetical protein
MNGQNDEPKTDVPYLTIVSYFLENQKDTIPYTDIMIKFGDSLTDITTMEDFKAMQDYDDVPDGFIQSEYEYRESEERKCTMDITYREGRLVAFRSQIFFEGKAAETERTKYFESEFVPLMNKFIGEKNIQYDKSTGSYFCSNFHGLIVTFSLVNGIPGISTSIYEKAFH